jgi:hypothetical protein
MRSAPGVSGKTPSLVARSGRTVVLSVTCALVCVLLASAAAAQATTQTFNYTGGEQTFTVPAGVTSVEVTAVGGHGGSATASGGAAAQVTGKLSVTPGETLYVEVGGNGQNGSPNGGGLAGGGFNGGAPGGAGGGGASDVRTSPRSNGLSPDDRLIVAAGGGGSGQSGSCLGGAGGAAEQEGEKGDGCGNNGGGPGTQTTGGIGGGGGCGEGQSGALGLGGEGGGDGFNGTTCNLDTGGGGGGGLYGGGGGCGASLNSSGGGGGGSSLVPSGGTSVLASPSAAPEIQITYGPPSPLPTVVTEPATAVASKSATLNATVNPEGSQVTSCTFEYGTTTAYGSSAPCASLPGSGTSPVPVSAAISGLNASTAYHFRIAATNGGGTSRGADQGFTTAPPQEELPEIGRCHKLSKPTGKYQIAGCTTKSAGEDSGYYEWTFEPGRARSFTFKTNAGMLETVAGIKIKCRENIYSGEYTGSKTATVNLRLYGCEPTNRIGIKCQSMEAQAGEVVFNTLEGNLGYIANGTEPTVGMALTPTAAEAPYVTQFHCGEVSISVTGAVIARYAPVNTMTTTFTVSFTETKGKQSPEALEGGLPQLLSMIIGESAPAQTGFKAPDKVTNQEGLEIKAST